MLVEMNPSLDLQVVREAWAADPVAAATDFRGDFRADLERLIRQEAYDGCVCPGRFELAPAEGIHYAGFCDPSGGSADSYSCAVAHAEQGLAVLDCLRERKPPFSPDDVTKEFAALLKSYRISQVVGDRYAGLWPRERFAVHGIQYIPSEKTKSELYLEFLPILNAGRCELLDHPRLRAQLISLERRTARGGRDSVDHPANANAHDDLANAACGALLLAAVVPREPFVEVLRIATPHPDDERKLWDPANDFGFRARTRKPRFGRH